MKMIKVQENESKVRRIKKSKVTKIIADELTRA